MTRTHVAARGTKNHKNGSPPCASIAARALRWFDRHARELPWRDNKTRYRVWVSEIMLQQTQVATVIPYFQRFIVQFPSVKALAAADENDVLRAWEGLGYYRRARQMHAAAQIIVARHGGRCPRNFDDWLALPGIGRYTAGAILSISEDQRLPILEANTIRLYCRLLGERRDPRNTATSERLWQFAESLLPQRRVGDFNQALMEIGSRICTVRNPACSECPLRDQCTARRLGKPHDFPRKQTPSRLTSVRQIGVVIRRGDAILMRKCAADGRWGGLWDVARFEVGKSQTVESVVVQIRRLTGLNILLSPERFAIRFGVTRFKIDLRCHESVVVRGRLRKGLSAEWAWIPLRSLGNIPLNVTARKIVRRLYDH